MRLASSAEKAGGCQAHERIKRNAETHKKEEEGRRYKPEIYFVVAR
jgi:hypothetical protein